MPDTCVTPCSPEAQRVNTAQSPTWQQYLELCKPRVVSLIVFTAVVGMLLAARNLPSFMTVIWATMGIGLAASSAAAINHLLDQRIDAIMKRTRNRPLPSGQLSQGRVLGFALALTLISMLILVFAVNKLTAALTFLSLIGYAFVYTAYLKHATPQNIVIGGAAGAAPPLLGWTAITNEVHYDALLLVLIIFAWTPPHFWALAIFRKEDYARADIPMLPVTHGENFTRWQIFFYTILLVISTVLPYLTGMSGLFYLGGVTVLNGGFLYYAIRLLRSSNQQIAMRTFSFSVMYLMMLFVFLLVDHYLPWGRLSWPLPLAIN